MSTWTKPKELETIEFTDPVPDIAAAKKKVQAAHKLKVKSVDPYFTLIGEYLEHSIVRNKKLNPRLLREELKVSVLSETNRDMLMVTIMVNIIVIM